MAMTLVSCALLVPGFPAAHVAEIGSKRNSAFKLLSKLRTRQGRRKLGRFFAEGETFLRMRPRGVFVRKSRWKQEGLAQIRQQVLEGAEAPEAPAARPLFWGGGVPEDDGAAARQASYAVLENELFDQISTQEKSQGVLCVFGMPLDTAVSKVTSSNVVVLDGVEDPNNLGVILRTMEAFGSRTLLVTKGTVDVFNPKVVRCSMGAAVRGRVDVAEVSASELRPMLRGYRLFSTRLDGSLPSTRLQERLTGRDAFLFGHEARGLSRELLDLADEHVRIPMSPHVDSLNVGVAVGVLLHSTLKG
ncbi:unnamed protein product [Effrenium voratum]|nr:unnamed protein product [Effrenium voratum]